jgi:general nucleoside transport system ATP-binding protein
VQSLLSLRKLRKEFPGCLANDDVDLDVLPGEIHALLGENGAGKSTLVKMIYGVLKPDNGEMIWNDQRVDIETPSAARALGIGMVFQHFSLFEALSVSENIALGIPKDLAGPGLDERIIEVSRSYGLPLDPHREVHSLSVGERQRIEIVRCLLQKPKLLIMDEPTSVLTPQEADKLFETLERLSSEGVAILYISHRLEEIRKLCHKATILRLGRVVSDCDPSLETARSLAEMMMGSDLTLPEKGEEHIPGPVRFKVSNLSSQPEDPFAVSLKDVSFQLRDGEILGVAGLAGNGQSELMDMLSGEGLADNPDVIVMEEKPVGALGPGQRRDLGLGFVPEERLGHGAVPDMTLWENGFLSAMGRQGLMQNGFIKVAKSVEFAEAVVKRFNVKTSGVDHNATSLSGGNLQKFIVGREIEQDPRVLIVLQPTWGVDAGSAAAIHQELMDLATKGTAVLVISQDLDELFAVSDRIAVMCEGRLSESAPASETTVEQIGLLMGGLHAEQAAEREAS